MYRTNTFDGYASSTEPCNSSGFLSHTIFYNDENPAQYSGERPREANVYEPFVTTEVVVTMLERMFLPGAYGNKR